jgi:transposase
MGVMEVVVAVGAGLDVHKKTVVVCVINGQVTPPTKVTRRFGTFLHQLESLRDWLLSQGCTHVAMESTGVYWMPVYRVLEAHFTIVLGNARHMKNVPGRKTDVSDAEWIGDLLRHGLIRPNFVPPEQIRMLRQVTRFRRKLVQTRTSAELRVQKLLETSNIKLGSVASEVFGVSGRQMLAALSQGMTDADVLADMAKARLRRKIPELRQALKGNFAASEAALLRVQLDVIDGIEQRLEQLQQVIDRAVYPYESFIHRLCTAPGIQRTIAIDVLAEIGTDTSAWKDEDAFSAWAGLCPGNKESAGRRRRVSSRDGNPYLKSILTQAATSAIKSSPYLRRRHGRICSRRGARVANLAIAHELGISLFHMVNRGEDYKPPAVSDPKVHKEKQTQRLVRRLNQLGYQVTCTPIA